MAEFKVDTAEINVLIAAMEVLNNSLEVSVQTADTSSSCGSSINELLELYKSIGNAKTELKNLIEKTIAYFKSVSLMYDEADYAEAELLLKDMTNNTSLSGNGGFR